MKKEKFLEIMQREMVLAFGCTEPIAIAFAAALARKYVKGDNVTQIKVSASGNVIKNAMSVSIPGTGSSGINLAAALGTLAEDADKELEVLTGLTATDINNAREMIKDGVVLVEVSDSTKKLYIDVTVVTDISKARVVIEDGHTNVSLIDVDGTIIKNSFGDSSQDKDEEELKFLSLDNIWEFVQSVDIKELGIVYDSMEYNMKIARDGLEKPYGLEIGRTMKLYMERGLLGDDLANNAMAMTAAGSDARMAGATIPVISNSGSGNQGITATVPVVVAAEVLKVEHEKMMRALTLSHLITIYIKSNFGRLSAFCGAAVAGTGASCGISYLLGGGIEEIKSSIQNMLGNVTGMLCDGAKAGCALKVSTCVNAAIQSAVLAMEGHTIKSTDGIIENNVEETIQNLCKLGNFGTNECDRIILDIMLKKVN
jgi:L-cysteine desulfidase